MAAHLVGVPNPRSLRTPPKPRLGEPFPRASPHPPWACFCNNDPDRGRRDRTRSEDTDRVPWVPWVPWPPRRRRRGLGGGSEMAPHVHRAWTCICPLSFIARPSPLAPQPSAVNRPSVHPSSGRAGEPLDGVHHPGGRGGVVGGELCASVEGGVGLGLLRWRKERRKEGKGKEGREERKRSNCSVRSLARKFRS